MLGFLSSTYNQPRVVHEGKESTRTRTRAPEALKSGLSRTGKLR